MKKAIFVLVILIMGFVSAQITPYTPEIITAKGTTTVPVSFFNTGEAQTYSASLEVGEVVRLSQSSTLVGSEEFGSFNLVIGEGDALKKVYFDKLSISNALGLFQEIPIIIGIESRTAEIEYDVSIDFDAERDLSIIAGETILSPAINVYKLNYNNQGPNGVALRFEVYSMDGELIISEEEVVSVSTQAAYEHFFNLGTDSYPEVLIVVSAIHSESLGLDLYQVSLGNEPLLSPPTTGYGKYFYIGLFVFLLSSIILISFLWYNRSLKQVKNWREELNYVKKTQFSDSAKAIRKLEAQKDVLKRAYDSKYISKSSFQSAMGEINTLSEQYKKRL